MANYFLLFSSCLMMITQITTILIFKPPIFFSLLAILAFTTSIWNHGFTHQLAQIIDRIYMIIYIVINTIIIYLVVQDIFHMVAIYAIMISGITCVVAAMIIRKYTKDKDIRNPYRIRKPGNYYHFYSHCVVMIIHSVMAYKMIVECDSSIPIVCNNDWIDELMHMVIGQLS